MSKRNIQQRRQGRSWATTRHAVTSVEAHPCRAGSTVIFGARSFPTSVPCTTGEDFNICSWDSRTNSVPARVHIACPSVRNVASTLLNRKLHDRSSRWMTGLKFSRKRETSSALKNYAVTQRPSLRGGPQRKLFCFAVVRCAGLHRTPELNCTGAGVARTSRANP